MSMITDKKTGLPVDTDCACYIQGESQCGYGGYCSCCANVGMRHGHPAKEVLKNFPCDSGHSTQPLRAASGSVMLQELETQNPIHADALRKAGLRRDNPWYYERLRRGNE